MLFRSESNLILVGLESNEAIHIFNPLGEEVEIPIVHQDSHILLDMSMLSSGVYLIQAGEEKVVRKKILKR